MGFDRWPADHHAKYAAAMPERTIRSKVSGPANTGHAYSALADLPMVWQVSVDQPPGGTCDIGDRRRIDRA